MNPKVFVSHASEDKERFVLHFATKLREHGVDAWLDKWEMLPGDSLVEKVFEEGLKEANVIIIVLSNFSVDKPWVREELNAGIMKRFSNKTKIIPVVIDDCEVPEALKSTVWEKIVDINNFSNNLDRIVASIYGQKDKPALGNIPKYINSPVINILELTKIDNLALKHSCEYAIKNNNKSLEFERVFLKNDSWNIPETELLESLEVLNREGYIRISRTLGSVVFSLTTLGIDKYATTYLKNYNGIQNDIISLLVNEDISNNKELMDNLNQPQLVIDHILNSLELEKYVLLSKMTCGFIRIYNISPSLKRLLS